MKKKKLNPLNELKRKLAESTKIIGELTEKNCDKANRIKGFEKIVGYPESARVFAKTNDYGYGQKQEIESLESHLFQLSRKDDTELNALKAENAKLWHLLRGVLRDTTLDIDYPKQKENEAINGIVNGVPRYIDNRISNFTPFKQ